MADNARWFVVHTYSGYENKVASNIITVVENRKMQDQIFEVRIPTETVTEIKDDKVREIFETSKVCFATLGYASEVMIQKDKSGIAEDAVSTVIHGATIYMPFAELVDIEKEIARLQKEEKKLEGELKRVNGMLSNEKFVSKAPQAKIDEEKAKLEKYTNMMEQVKERLAQLTK